MWAGCWQYSATTSNADKLGLGISAVAALHLRPPHGDVFTPEWSSDLARAVDVLLSSRRRESPLSRLSPPRGEPMTSAPPKRSRLFEAEKYEEAIPLLRTVGAGQIGRPRRTGSSPLPPRVALVSQRARQ